MAEGHAVVRWARALAPLVGEPLLRIDVPRRWRERAAILLGTHLQRIETRGKHLLLWLSSGDVIHGHAMQYGSWQVGAAGMTPRKERRYVRLHLHTRLHEAIYQRVVAGVGHIYKSEGLFLARIDPRRPTAGVTDAELARLRGELAPLMHEGTRHPGAIATLPAGVGADGDRTWVYRRRTRACFVCGTPIEMVRQGELRRATYYCPNANSNSERSCQE